MTPRENIMAALRGEKHEYIPNFFSDLAFCGASALTFDCGPIGGGRDGFGVLWKTSISAAGQACPITSPPVLEDIADWRRLVKFPDIDAFDWAGLSERQLAGVNRAEKPVEFQMWNGPFERVTHLMGFENALCAMYEDPDEVSALVEAVTDYQIAVLKKGATYFKPDFVTTFDDVATERGLFTSPALYRRLIGPAHRRFNEAARELGIIPLIHCCGKCEELIPDFLEEGYAAWTSAQPSNDILGILRRYKGRFAVMGGYDSNGLPSRPDATDDDMRAEVRRCLKAYGSEDNYLFMGFKLSASPDMSEFMRALAVIDEECKRCGRL